MPTNVLELHSLSESRHLQLMFVTGYVEFPGKVEKPGEHQEMVNIEYSEYSKGPNEGESVFGKTDRRLLLS